MRTFNVLDRHEAIHCNKLLEASAGTGKTFSIENLVMRLLIEPKDGKEPLLIDEILVVTFTKMATRELKERIRKTLVCGLRYLRNAYSGNDREAACSDYLLSHIEAGRESIKAAIGRIERALFCFDKCQIFTIHGFCWRMLSTFALQAGVSLGATCVEEGVPVDQRKEMAVRDFLRTRLKREKYSPLQLKTIVSECKRREDLLLSLILEQAGKPLPIHPYRGFDEQFAEFRSIVADLKHTLEFCGEKLYEDLDRLKENYLDYSSLPKGILKRFSDRFCKEEFHEVDFEAVIEDGLPLFKFMDESNAKKRKKTTPEQLHYPGFIEILKTRFSSLFNETVSVPLIIARMAADCQLFINEFQAREEMLGPDELLVSMGNALNNGDFVDLVRKQYAAAIIDEFQDTDPLQWKIFSKLFIAEKELWNGYLTLVGDPKQSIYAFRQADIYTYLDAAIALGADSHATLDTNYRSVPSLVDAVNLLFDAMKHPFPLPRNEQSLPFRAVNAGREMAEGIASGPAPLQFWVAAEEAAYKTESIACESALIIPKIAEEVIRLKKEEAICFKQCAVLVSDHRQAKRVSDGLRAFNIPVSSQRGADLWKSHVVADMIDLLCGIVDGKDGSTLKVALAGRPIGMTVSDLKAFGQDERIVPILTLCQELRGLLFESGFGAFYRNLLKSRWHADNRSVIEILLAEPGGADYFREMQDLADWMISEEHRLNLSPAGMIGHLERYSKSQVENQETKVYADLEADGVSIMTMHVSKGLEFEAVFALGLISAVTFRTRDLIPVYKEGKYHLCGFADENDPAYSKKRSEDDAERMRQLYVALTRAKRHLYVPIVRFAKKDSEKKVRMASGIELLLRKLHEGDCQGEEDPLSTLVKLADRHPDKMSLIPLDRDTEQAPYQSDSVPIELLPPNEFSIPGEQEYIQSFTSLASRFSHPPVETSEELKVPHDYATEVKSRHTLPSGNETGVLLHKILEELPFDAAKGSRSSGGLKEQIRPYVKGTKFDPWLSTLAEIVEDVLKAPLDDVSISYALSDIHPSKIFRETEFLYPCSQSIESFDSGEVRPGFLKGVVDLFFEHNGRYYVLDWKTNWLGPDCSFYRKECLEEAMRANRYDLQAKIYAEAMRRYLKIFDKRPFEEIFGGIYYIFLRGVGPGTGILHFYPEIEGI